MPRSFPVLASLALTCSLCLSFGGCGSDRSADHASNRAVHDDGDGENAVETVTPFETPDENSPTLDDPRSGGWHPADDPHESAGSPVPRPDESWTPPGPEPHVESAIPVEVEPQPVAPDPRDTFRQPEPYVRDSTPAARAPVENIRPTNPLRMMPSPVSTAERPVRLDPSRKMAAQPSTLMRRPTGIAAQPLRASEPKAMSRMMRAPQESVSDIAPPPAHLARAAPPPPGPVAGDVPAPAQPRSSRDTVLRLVPRESARLQPEGTGAGRPETANRVAEAQTPPADHDTTPNHESHTHASAPPAEATVAAPPPEDEPFHRVNVFYGTDRAGLSEMERSGRDYLNWLQWSAIALAGTVGIAFLNLRAGSARTLKGLLVIAVLATCGLSGWTVVRWLQYVPLEDRPQMAYGGARGELKFGTCEVSIPKHHQIGQLEAPSLLRVEFQTDPEKHVAVLETEELPEKRFYERLRQRVLDSSAKQAFVFVHGYNVSFDDAVRRTAQLAFDLKFDGAPICYSWPSQAEYLGYSTDEDNVIWTESDLERFLLGIQSSSGAERIHLIAHSMGNRALTSVLRSFSRDLEDGQPLFDEVVLTAPDVDADHFRRNLAPAIVKTARRVTLYASSNDDALAMSKKFHGGHPRAGESGENIVVMPEIDTIDVSAVDTSLVGHSYYGDNTTVLDDLFHLVQQGLAPEDRCWLAPQPFEDMRYWVFLSERMGGRPAAEAHR